MYPHFEPLGLQHQETVSRLFFEARPDASELTFTNLFIWRQHYRFHVSRLDGCLVVAGRTPGNEPFYLPPVGPGAAAACRRLLAEKTAAGLLARVSEHDLARCELRPGEKFRIVEEHDQADYVYLTDSLIRLAGNRYSAKRNHLRRFKAQYPWEYQSLEAEMVPDCMRLEEEWCRTRVCPRQLGLEAERVAIWEALENFGRLAYTGGAILVDGRLEAFTLGGSLNDRCGVIHIEKANPGIEGIYTAINQQYLAHELAGYEFVNREQDLGDAGLRRSKLSYHPYHFVRKHTVRAI
ncbi:MAG: phosphatidylglycerol lysyltransferase domain-containing protein [Pseudomonadota bacterium]